MTEVEIIKKQVEALEKLVEIKNQIIASRAAYPYYPYPQYPWGTWINTNGSIQQNGNWSGIAQNSQSVTGLVGGAKP